MGPWSAGVALALVTVLTSFCADYLVGSIDETCEAWNIPKAFVGVILLPIVGNGAEHVTVRRLRPFVRLAFEADSFPFAASPQAVWMAAKGKMELVMGVAVGSSIQIAAGMSASPCARVPLPSSALIILFSQSPCSSSSDGSVRPSSHLALTICHLALWTDLCCVRLSPDVQSTSPSPSSSLTLRPSSSSSRSCSSLRSSATEGPTDSRCVAEPPPPPTRSCGRGH